MDANEKAIRQLRRRMSRKSQSGTLTNPEIDKIVNEISKVNRSIIAASQAVKILRADMDDQRHATNKNMTLETAQVFAARVMKAEKMADDLNAILDEAEACCDAMKSALRGQPVDGGESDVRL